MWYNADTSREVYPVEPQTAESAVNKLFNGGNGMQNITEILKSFSVEIPTDKKADFDKLFNDNYKTIAEVNKITEKYNRATEDANAAKESLNAMTTEFNAFKANSANADEFKTKYENLVAENERKERERAAAYAEAQERAEFDKYFTDNKKEWNNPFIADGYFAKFKEAKGQEANKGKMLADILNDLTKDDTTAFKTPTPDIKLKGAEPIGNGAPTPKLTNKFF